MHDNPNPFVSHAISACIGGVFLYLFVKDFIRLLSNDHVSRGDIASVVMWGLVVMVIVAKAVLPHKE